MPTKNHVGTSPKNKIQVGFALIFNALGRLLEYGMTRRIH